ncbi:tRNA-modifying protein YgfZ [Marinomonas aquimarina]|uniref:tRNA-modifying protein YgfZ n=1 Tax=Marinomonas aquimarina TaxID=295068 RepID=A0A1A8T8Q5_9GAMM|nr:folate-binding protein YgfZ [Marinomonas aquimarina]SBS28286.1 tRNA-modifying protein YgfZ [Marinomonas aquimarina]
MQLQQLLSETLPATSYGHSQDLGVISIQGPDSVKLLQGQTTADMKLVSEQASVFGAVCTPKGRIIANFYILQKANDSFLMVLKQDVLDTLLAHLKKYAVFFKTDLEDVSAQYQVSSLFALTDTLEPQEHYDLAIPTTHQEGCYQLILNNTYYQETLTVAHSAEELPTAEDPSAHKVMGLLAARPLLGQAHLEEILPQWINMQRNGGISFTKGCYTGQEIVARMKYRGKSKKHLALCTCEGPIKIGSDVLNAEGKAIGSVFDCAPAGPAYVAQLILNVEQDEISDATVEGSTITLLPLPYELGS